MVPTGNIPGLWLLVSVALQLSLADGAAHDTDAWHPVVVAIVMSVGHPVITGSVSSVTVILNVQSAVLP